MSVLSSSRSTSHNVQCACIIDLTSRDIWNPGGTVAPRLAVVTQHSHHHSLTHLGQLDLPHLNITDDAVDGIIANVPKVRNLALAKCTARIDRLSRTSAKARRRYDGSRRYRRHLRPSSTKIGQEPLFHVHVAAPEAKIPFLSTFLHTLHTRAPGDPNRMHSIVQSFFMEKKQKIMSQLAQKKNRSSTLRTSSISSTRGILSTS